MTTTAAQSNEIIRVGRIILSGLGIIIGIVFWGTFYGTSYMKDTRYSIDTVSRDVRSLTTNFNEFKKDDKEEKRLMKADIQFLKDNCVQTSSIKVRTGTYHRNYPGGPATFTPDK